MSWIAIHDEVLGSKLRGFRKKVNCSEAEALGILTYFWLWARKNTDITGFLDNTDKEDIKDVVKPIIADTIDAETVADALIECGWIDDIEGQLYVHDWSEWQSYWYAYLSKKEKDRDRKRKDRANKSKDLEDSPETSDPEPEKAAKKPKKKEKKPEKVSYAENVKMLPEERQKLVDSYGEEFVLKCIEELDNYKGASGKKYASDYRAILSWVIEKCGNKYPYLKKKPVVVPADSTSNPFEEYK